MAMANNATLGMLKRVEVLPRNVIIDTGRSNSFLLTLKRRNDPSNPAPNDFRGGGRWALWNFFGGFGKKLPMYY